MFTPSFLSMLFASAFGYADFWQGGFNPFDFMNEDFGSFGKQMKTLDLNKVPSGTKKVFKDGNGQGVIFKSSDGRSTGYSYTSGGGGSSSASAVSFASSGGFGNGESVLTESAFDSSFPKKAFSIRASGVGKPVSMYLSGVRKGTKKIFKDGNTQGTIFKSKDGRSGGYAFTSGNGDGSSGASAASFSTGGLGDPESFFASSGFDSRNPDGDYAYGTGSDKPRAWDINDIPKGTRKVFKDKNSVGTVFRSQDGKTGGFTYTSGNGKGFAMGSSSSSSKGGSSQFSYSSSQANSKNGNGYFKTSQAGYVPNDFFHDFFDIFDQVRG